MISKNFTKIGGIGALGILFLGSLVYAQSVPLSATCSGTPNVNVITWTAAPAGGTTPYSFQWSGTNVTGTTQTVTATYNSTGTFSAGVTVRDTATSTASSSVVVANCSATVTSLPVATTTPPIHRRPFFKEPKLEINPAGNILVRGMEVLSVGANSFVGKVWGITFTVDTSASPNLVLREGRELGRFDITQLQVGDEVSVSGSVSEDQPLLIRARVVRNFSIVIERVKPKENQDNENNQDNEDKRGKEKKSVSSSSTDVQGIRDQLRAILEQIKGLQGKIRGHSD